MAYLLLPGSSGDAASAADSAALDITGDLELIMKLAADDWTPAAIEALVSKWVSSGAGGYELDLVTNGTLRLIVDNGTTNTNFVSTSAVGFTNETAGWVRVTLDVNDGGGNSDATFYTSTDTTDDYTAVSWSQLGSVVSNSALTIGTNTQTLYVGARALVGLPFAGKVYRLVLRDGIGGTVAFDADFSDPTTWNGARTAVTEKANSATVTLQGDAELVGAAVAASGSAPLLMGI